MSPEGTFVVICCVVALAVMTHWRVGAGSATGGRKDGRDRLGVAFATAGKRAVVGLRVRPVTPGAARSLSSTSAGGVAPAPTTLTAWSTGVGARSPDRTGEGAELEGFANQGACRGT